MAQNEMVMKGEVSHAAADMKKWVNNKDMSDMKFLIGPARKTFHAHRILLAARSEVFRAMFSEQSKSQAKDGEIPFVLSDIAPEIFIAMMEYIYTNCVTLNSKIAIDVMGTAIEYGLDGLRTLCNEYLKLNLSVNTACDTMQSAVTFGQDELQEATMTYIEQNTQNVFKSKSFHEMSDVALSTVLKNNNLRIDEQDILNHVREWATVNSVVTGRKAHEVVKNIICHVRLPLLSPEELKDVEVENAKDHLIPHAMLTLYTLIEMHPSKVHLIAFAWKCHALRAGEKDNPTTTKRKGTVTRDCHKGMQLT